jgi:hypothetical protein
MQSEREMRDFEGYDTGVTGLMQSEREMRDFEGYDPGVAGLLFLRYAPVLSRGNCYDFYSMFLMNMFFDQT